jgi:predicted CXXCH cytochrome family protein
VARVDGRLLATAAACAVIASLAWVIQASRRGEHVRSPASQPIGTLAASYVNPIVCAGCHQRIAASYHLTGMGRSFHAVGSSEPEGNFRYAANLYHRPSDRHYTISSRDGHPYQRRYQLGFQGKDTNIVEKRIDYVIGSGNHARTFVSRNREGELIELPVSWYAENGGYWAMSPGYNRAGHSDFRRSITFECMFCHNSYPAVKPGADLSSRRPVFPARLPEGIDCQRCHGPGSSHIAAAGSGSATRDAIRQSIINPARLNRQRQLELCLQCHLETTSGKLPASIRRNGRGIFSYRPGEPLQDYILHFDRKAADSEDRFEIAGAGYRLVQSACFQNSQMTCLTCHDPHQIPHGNQATGHYAAVCRTCHIQSLHVSHMNPAADCTGCHMPKRRTQDAVHVIMTDHLIQRRKPSRNLLASLPEPSEQKHLYRGEVIPFYPDKMDPADEVYLAAAQVQDSANLAAGIPRLSQAIEARKKPEPEFLTVLGDAYAKSGQHEEALQSFEAALRIRPEFRPAVKGLVAVLFAAGQLSRTVEAITHFAAISALDPELLTDLGNAYFRIGASDQAEKVLLEASVGNPDLPETQNLLGLIALEKGNRISAEKYFREAIRLHPDLAPAHNNLANLLAGAHDYDQAKYHFKKAVALDPADAEARKSYSLLLELDHAKRHPDRLH